MNSISNTTVLKCVNIASNSYIRMVCIHIFTQFAFKYWAKMFILKCLIVVNLILLGIHITRTNGLGNSSFVRYFRIIKKSFNSFVRLESTNQSDIVQIPTLEQCGGTVGQQPRIAGGSDAKPG